MKTKAKLTTAQIKDIVETLHYNIQFYDRRGKRANGFIGDKIEEVLLRYYGPKKSKTVKLPK